MSLFFVWGYYWNKKNKVEVEFWWILELLCYGYELNIVGIDERKGIIVKYEVIWFKLFGWKEWLIENI